MDQSKINTSSLNGLNNLKLRKKAKALVDEVRKSADPVQAAERLIEEMTKVYGVNNRWAHATADMVLQELEVAFRSKEFKMSGKDSQHLLNKVTGTKDRIKESANENSFAGRAASNAKNIASSFMPTPSTLFRGMMISNPLLGAGVDAAKAIMGGPKDEVNFGDIDLENESDNSSAGFTGQLSGIDGDEITSLVKEQNYYIKELVRITSEAWDINSKSMESMVEEAEEANNLTRANSEDSFDDMELKRENANESNNNLGEVKSSKDEVEEKKSGLLSSIMKGIGLGGGAVAGSGILGGIMKLTGKIKSGAKGIFKNAGGLVKKLGLFGVAVSTVTSAMDLMDDSKNLESFGKTNLNPQQMIGGFFANFIGDIFGLFDSLLGTDMSSIMKKFVFDFFDETLGGIGEAIGSWVYDSVQSIKEMAMGVVDLLADIINWFKGLSVSKLIDNLKGKGSDLFDNAKEKGSEAIKGFMDGLSRKPEFSSAGGRSRANRMRDTSTGTSPVIAPVSTNSQVNNTTNTTISSPQRSPYNYEDIGISAIPG